MKIQKKEIFYGIILVMTFCLIINNTSGLDATICCEKTISGFYCQDVPKSQCITDSINPNTGKKYAAEPTSCDSTSYCKAGYCYDSNEGTCLDKTPEEVCTMNKGIWSETFPEQCSPGCCILGDQAAFVSLVRCKNLSSMYGLATNFNKQIKSEVDCVLNVMNQDKGACVYEFEFQKTCKFTTRYECTNGLNVSGKKGQFYKGRLCTDEELGTNCGPSTKTVCVAGKDEVYFTDTCGNAANIYDISRNNDKKYWKNVISKEDSCNADSQNGNANSATCGNCNYLQGSICRTVKGDSNKARVGDNICADLNCKKTSNGKSYKHGESWCVYDDYGEQRKGKNSVGSRFYKHICINGEEVLEQCADFRQEECIQDKITMKGGGEFSQAACRVNRWQDCLNQMEKLDCENSNKRDCYWKDFLYSKNSENESIMGLCLPSIPPGLKFWAGDEAKNLCSAANDICIVKYEKGLIGGGEKCVDNCECLEKDWEQEHIDVCTSLGDCGPNVNWLGKEGYRASYNISKTKYKGGDKDD